MLTPIKFYTVQANPHWWGELFLTKIDPGGVGHDHVQHKALRKIILLNTVILFVESTESHNSYFIVNTYNHCYC